MGTFGTGPFDSDGALDLLDQLAEKPPEQRHDALAHMFTYVSTHPHLLMREFFPDEIVAAAALVAANLPGGEHLSEQSVAATGEVRAAALPPPEPELAAAAHQALLGVAGPDGPWHQGWTDQAGQIQAQATIDDLSTILRQASRELSPSGRPS